MIAANELFQLDLAAERRQRDADWKARIGQRPAAIFDPTKPETVKTPEPSLIEAATAAAGALQGCHTRHDPRRPAHRAREGSLWGRVVSAHTPGPWHWRGNTLEPVEKRPDISAVYSILDRDGGFGYLASDLRATGAELEADFRLIAAAPDLLALAMRIEPWLAGHECQEKARGERKHDSQFLLDLRTVISKATETA